MNIFTMSYLGIYFSGLMLVIWMMCGDDMIQEAKSIFSGHYKLWSLDYGEEKAKKLVDMSATFLIVVTCVLWPAFLFFGLAIKKSRGD